jgi:glutamine synthetase
MTAADVLKLAKDEGVHIVDFRFVDLLGTRQHTTKSIDDVDEDTFTEGVGFDGSSIRGFRATNESDMLMIPAARQTSISTKPTPRRWPASRAPRARSMRCSARSNTITTSSSKVASSAPT